MVPDYITFVFSVSQHSLSWRASGTMRSLLPNKIDLDHLKNGYCIPNLNINGSKLKTTCIKARQVMQPWVQDDLWDWNSLRIRYLKTSFETDENKSQKLFSTDMHYTHFQQICIIAACVMFIFTVILSLCASSDLALAFSVFSPVSLLVDCRTENA